MKNKSLVFLAVALLALGAQVSADPLTVEAYCDLTVERMQLAAFTWGTEARPPYATEEEELWSRYRTTPQEYYGFMGIQGAAVKEYLSANPYVQKEIDELAVIIGNAVESGTK
jgi:hypothetical protein